LLLRKYYENDPFKDESFANSIEYTISQWKLINQSGQISSIDIYRFDFNPTEFYYIFDNKVIILGHYLMDLTNPSKIKVKQNKLFLITNESEFGRAVIDQYIEKFNSIIKTLDNNESN